MRRSKKHQLNERQRRELAVLMAKRFRGRRGVALVGTPPNFDVRCENRDGRVTADEIRDKHLAGRSCLGVYVVCHGNVCWFAAIDLDNKLHAPDPDIRSKVESVARYLSNADVDFRVAYSQSGRGFHVMIFFAEAVPAWMARRFLQGVISKADIGTPEVFPKQDSVPIGKCGSAIRLPLFNKSRFVEPLKAWAEPHPLKSLQAVVPLSIEAVKQAAARLNIDLSAPPKPKPTVAKRRRDGKGLKANSAKLPRRVQQLLANPFSLLSRRWNGSTSGLDDPSDSGLVMAIACSLAGHGVSTEDIEAAVRVWCSANGYAKGKRTDWVELTVQRAEAFVEAQQRKETTRRSAVDDLAQTFSGPIARLIRNRKRKR